MGSGIVLASPDNDVPVLQTPQARWRRVVMPLLVCLVVGLLVVLLTAGSRGGSAALTGSGSTLARPLIAQGAADFRDAASDGSDWVLDGPGIDYEPVGSLGGIMRLTDAPEVAFAVADYPLSSGALKSKGLAQFPIVVGGVAVVHNLLLPEGKTLRLDAPTLAAIYLGEITRWNDPAIAGLNRGTPLPNEPITPVHRSDGSGSTLGFTRYLAAGSEPWADGPGADTLVDWPTRASANGSGGMIAEIGAVAGSLGYVEVGQATRAGLAPVALANRAGEYVAPTASGMREAIAGVDWSGSDGFATPLTPSRKARAYPLTVAVYAIVRDGSDPARDRERALEFLAFVIDDDSGVAGDLGYLPLPDAAAEAIQSGWRAQFGPAR